MRIERCLDCGGKLNKKEMKQGNQFCNSCYQKRRNAFDEKGERMEKGA